jgi:hypothetical protein
MRFHHYAALEALLNHQEAEARKHLGVVHKPDLSAFSVRVFDLVNELLPYQPGKPPKHFDEGASSAAEAFLNSNKTSRLGRDYVVRTCRHIARHNRSWKPLIWLFFKRHGILFAILLGVALMILASLTS